MIADDPTTPGGIEAREVLETFVRETDALVDLYVDGEVISTTGEHPFWVVDKGWVEAKDLVVGSLLLTGDGRIVDVDKVEKREGKFEVYNFRVEGIPTYFVSELGVLVHNACGGNPWPWQQPRATRRAQNPGDVTLPSEAAARREALKDYAIPKRGGENFKRKEIFGGNENLKGPNGEPYEEIEALDAQNKIVIIQHHKNGHYFDDVDQFEFPHYQGKNGRHISYPPT